MRLKTASLRRAGAVLLLLCVQQGHAAGREIAPGAACAELNGRAIAAAEIGLPSGGAQVVSAQLVTEPGAGEYCKVGAVILPADPQAPKIHLQIDLPSAWNGKALMLAGGGFNGVIRNPAGHIPHWMPGTPAPLARGYAVFNSDSGHQSGARYAGLHASLDGSFGQNDEALENFAGDFIKKTRDVAVRLIGARYGEAPAKMYVAGGSTGGREALRAITSWPNDFDGAIAFYPVWNPVPQTLQWGRVSRALAAPGAYPSHAKRKLVYDAVIAACDSADGLADGLISNPAGCRFDPAHLRCPGGAERGDGCLSDPQLRFFNTYQSPLALPYALGSGETQYPGYPVYAGADTSGGNPIVDLLTLNTEAPHHPATFGMPYLSQVWDMWMRYFVAGDPGLNALAVDPQNPGVYRERIAWLAGLQDIRRFDLAPFASRGGKLLMVQGMADVMASPRATAEYYRRMVAAMGAPAVAGFARYYEVPGFGHVFGRGFTLAWDALGALENWAEHGTAPTAQVATDVNQGAAGRTRPLCDYPSWPRYKGGDVNAAASFECVGS